MATGPQKYPGASTAYWWQQRWGGDLQEVNVCVLHTTEGIGLPSYDSGSMAPNLTAVANFAKKRLNWYQHFDIDRSSRALRNLAGGVQTNTLNVTQVELDGTCDYSKRERWNGKVAGRDYIYWGEPPEWALRDLSDFLRWLNAKHGVPLTGPSMWLTYGPDARRKGITPASYGASPARMSFSAWNKFRGICGHQHVPENDHGDPGSLPFAKLIALAKNTSEPNTPPPASSGGTYTVKAGDTLWAIARAHGTTVPALVDANDLRDPSRLAVGQKLKIPGGTASTYTVGRGDTLWSIAASKLGNGNRWREIASLNGLKNPDDLSVGQKLKLPRK